MHGPALTLCGRYRCDGELYLPRSGVGSRPVIGTCPHSRPRALEQPAYFHLEDPMKIHEYQAKEILRKYGVATPRGYPAFSVDEAVAAAKKLGGQVWVVKAQIHAGGRGKGGGVKVARSIDDVREKAKQILGMQLKTHQTGPAGQKVRRLLVEEGADIKKEL